MEDQEGGPSMLCSNCRKQRESSKLFCKGKVRDHDATEAEAMAVTTIHTLAEFVPA